jgi:hypothetical protein
VQSVEQQRLSPTQIKTQLGVVQQHLIDQKRQ